MQYIIQITKNETNSFGDQIFEVKFFDLYTEERIGHHYFINPEGTHEDWYQLLKQAEQTLKAQHTLPEGQKGN
jgi:hypothetical protein